MLKIRLKCLILIVSILILQGVARRRRLREHLEDLKRQRVARADEVERQRVEGEKRRQEELAIAEYNRQKEREKQNEIARCQREQQLMNIEDVLVTDNRARNRELKRMEHEDIRSFMREQYEIREKVQLKERYEALGELYKAFEPFPAKLAGDHMRTLQGLLQHDQSVAQVYLDVMDTLSQSSSHRSRVAEHSTDSVDRKRSVRYRRIFEGQLDNDLEVLPEGEGEESPTKSVLSNADGREQSARTLKALLPKHDPAHPPVRTLHHSPTKHSIRKNSALVPNKYDAQWIMFQNNPAQCFVRTSAETFPVPSESNAARRTMSALGPIIPSLQANTSLFEPAIATSGNDHAPHRDTRGAHPSAHQVTKTSFESDILQKFGASPSTLPKPGSVYADSFFDDSIQLESRSSLIPFARAPNELQPPAPQATTSQSDCQTFSQILFENTGEGIDKDMVDPYSQTVPSSDMRQMSFNPAGSTASGQLADFTASFDSSMFRSLSSVEEDKRSGIKNGKGSKSGGGGRKKLKDLLSTSADILAKSNEKEWLQYLETQRKATFASLSTLDAKADAAKRRIEKLTASATATFSDSAGAAGIEQIKIGGRPVEGNSSSSARPITPGGLSEMREKKQQVAQLKKELQELGIVDESILDFRTRQLAKAASESAIRMKAEKAMLRQYVGSSAVLHDEFYLMAVKPGDRHTTSLEVSEEVKKFAENVTRHVDGEELMFPSISSAEAVAPALPSRSTKVRTPAATRVTPKANLKFGHYQPAGDLFIETAEKAPEPKEPAVTLDLGVTSLTRNSSAQGNPVPVVRSVKKRMSKAKAASEALLPNIPSLLSISTLSASQSGLLPSFEPNISNPLGVIRGNPVSVAKEAPVVRHRKAFYDPSKSAASALQPPPPQQSSSTMSMSLAESTHGELAKKDSTISKSVELFINTPSASRRSMRKSSKGSFGVDDESVGSSTGFSPVDQRYPDLQPFEPEYRARGGGSIASAGSASIFLD